MTTKMVNKLMKSYMTISFSQHKITRMSPWLFRCLQELLLLNLNRSGVMRLRILVRLEVFHNMLDQGQASNLKVLKT